MTSSWHTQLCVYDDACIWCNISDATEGIDHPVMGMKKKGCSRGTGKISLWPSPSNLSYYLLLQLVLRAGVWVEWHRAIYSAMHVYKYKSPEPTVCRSLPKLCAIHILVFTKTQGGIDLFKNSHNAPIPYPAMEHYFNRNVHMCTHFCCQMGHYGIFD